MPLHRTIDGSGIIAILSSRRFWKHTLIPTNNHIENNYFSEKKEKRYTTRKGGESAQSSRKVLRRGQTIHVEAPVSTIPVFLRDGKQAYLNGKI
ncbi:hypothetical protein GE107_03930 [Cohnella sp. CFH 77786]|nr:hypothetical protein [Cohnella sp. CFH 77786]